jgi:cytochrome c
MRTSLIVSTVIAVAVVAFSARLRAADTAATDQATEGGKLFAKDCAKCHGKAGEGTKKAPPVVGKDALPLDPPATAKIRTTQFRTAQDVAQFVAAKMPANKPGSLTAEEYYAILAFDLKANGVDVAGKKIDPTTAAAIKLR